MGSDVVIVREGRVLGFLGGDFNRRVRVFVFREGCGGVLGGIEGGCREGIRKSVKRVGIVI